MGGFGILGTTVRVRARVEAVSDCMDGLGLRLKTLVFTLRAIRANPDFSPD